MEKISNHNNQEKFDMSKESTDTVAENTAPDYASEIAERKLAIKAIERGSLEKDDSEVEKLEAEIYDLEHQQAVGPAREQIAEHRQRLAEIEAAVKSGEVSRDKMAEFEIEVERRERELRELENVVKPKSDKGIEVVVDEESVNLIKSVQNYDELYAALDTLQSVAGSTGREYTAESLKQFIALVRNDYINIDNITRTHGLREKVAELIAAERKSEKLPQKPFESEESSEPVVSPEASEQPEESQEPESSEQSTVPEAIAEIDKAEYARLKKEYKESQWAYLAALDRDYADRAVFKKMLGLGRKEFSPAVQPFYDAFMAANQAFYSFARHSGHSEKIAERLSRERSAEAVPNVNVLLFDRHISRPVSERIDRQKVHLPEYVLTAKNALLEKIKKHPKTALGVGALLTVLNPAAVAAAVGVKYLGNKFYVAGKEKQREAEKDNAIESIAHDREVASLRDLEALSFEAERQAHDAKVRTNIAAVGAAFAAGSAYGASGGEQIVVEGGGGGEVVPDQVLESEPYFEGLSDGPIPPLENTAEVNPASETQNPAGQEELRFGGRSVAERAAPLNVTELSPDDVRPYDARLGYGEGARGPEVSVESELMSESIPEAEPENTPEAGAFEAMRTVERGDTLSQIVLDTLRERLQTGELVLPEGINQDRLAHYMYQSFPEMTSAQGVEPRLSLDEWKELGVESGNPHLIRPGEEINVQGLIEKMWGASVEAVTDSASAEGTVIPGVEADASVTTPDTTVEASTDSTPVEVVESSGNGSEATVSSALSSSEVSSMEDLIASTSLENNVSESDPIATAGETVPEVPAMEGEVLTEVVPTVEVTEGDAWLYEEPKVDVAIISSPEPIITERLSSLVTVWPENANFSLHEYLYKTMLQAYKTGHILLPEGTAELINKNETALYGFIERYMPEVSENTFSKIFRGVGQDALSADQWQALGVDRGNPQMIAAGEEIQTGKIMQIILERAGVAQNKS